MKTMTLLALVLCAGVVHAQQYERDRPRADSFDDRRGDDRDRGEDLQLVCYGQAEKIVAESRTGYQWNQEKHRYEPKSELTTGKSDFDSALNVSIHDDRGRIRIPRQLIPPMNSGGSDGWWDIEDLIVGHNEIRGRFRLNALNRPTIMIDRRNGTIVVDGMIKFNGRCDQDSGHRRF
ncbi:hypothetical protein B0920_17630 [Massilia sp. KIM]|uniref:hypothetical protein n=1 Tax=Massilia sp. KIM TaxID=1955422 RepID=UPI00098FF940|nr:hypothetical protein [Massilia sp. KIM]OON60774.1 hypothetical protein B0920_17630 [Massilia sp. KIM]